MASHLLLWKAKYCIMAEIKITAIEIRKSLRVAAVDKSTTRARMSLNSVIDNDKDPRLCGQL